MQAKSTDDVPTVAAIAILAYLVADIGHHAFGHGAACLLLGGQIRSLSSIHVDCTLTGAAIDLAGPLASLLVGIAALVAARLAARPASSMHLFFILAAAFNLFWFGLQLAFSAVTRTDDWAWPMHVMRMPEAGRYALIATGIIFYIYVLRLVAGRMASFTHPMDRARKIVVIAWIAAGVMACATAAFDPHPLIAILHSAAPQSLLLSIGLLFVPAKAVRLGGNVEPAPAIGFSKRWIMSAAALAMASIVFLGPGFAIRL